MQNETKFKRKVISDLKVLRNAWFFKTQEVTIRGIPDIILCVNSFFVALELKASQNEQPRPLQRHNLSLIKNKARGVSYVAYPENWDNILTRLIELDLF